MTEERFEQCMKRIADGDREALKDLYEEYLPYLYTVIYGILQNKEMAEDVTTDCFLKIWNTADRYKGGNGHKGYLATIARNMAIDELRKRKREVYAYDDEQADVGDWADTDDPHESGGPPGTQSSTVEDEVIGNLSVMEALDTLKPAEKEIVNLKVLAEMTFQEISDLLKIPMGTVTWRYREAMKKLRRYGYE